MKKQTLLAAVFVIIFGSIAFIPTLEAKTIDGVSCKYELTRPGGESLGTFQVSMTGYNDGNGTTVDQYWLDNKDGESTYLTDLITYDHPGLETILRFFVESPGKDKAFFDAYKKNGACPKLYSEVLNESIDINTQAIYPDNSSGYVVIKPAEELLRSGAGSWLTREAFFKEENIKSDKSCNYEFDIRNTKDKLNIKFITTYDKNNSQKYKINLKSINDLGEKILLDLNTDFSAPLGYTYGASIYIKSDVLKYVFNAQKCPAASSLYMYLNGATSDVYQYFLTNNKETAEDDGIGGDFDEGNIDSDTGKEEDFKPETGNDGNFSCETLLGKPLTDFLNGVFLLIKIAGPILCIILSMVDYTKAITGKDDTLLKNANKHLVLRLVIVLVIFMLPTLVNAILPLILGSNSGSCGIH